MLCTPPTTRGYNTCSLSYIFFFQLQSSKSQKCLPITDTLEPIQNVEWTQTLVKSHGYSCTLYIVSCSKFWFWNAFIRNKIFRYTNFIKFINYLKDSRMFQLAVNFNFISHSCYHSWCFHSFLVNLCQEKEIHVVCKIINIHVQYM